MKKDIHPEYREVVFMDTSTGTKFITRSTIFSKETIEEEVSSASHPFYTGKMKYVDSAGRVDKFEKKYKNWKKPGAKKQEAAAEVAKEE
ncbi:UNVERIFIED_CONTAM: hypothetical protein GTU68_052657 [Idotea baltica]|nr:hypothetical protein [Idotea baltica]